MKWATESTMFQNGMLCLREAERTDEALVSFASHGFKPEKVLKEGEWIAVLAVREL